MAVDSHSNFAYSSVTGTTTNNGSSPGTSGTSITLQTGDGASFSSNPPYNIVIWPAGAKALISNSEVCRVITIIGDTLTVLRQQEGQTGSINRNIQVGDQVDGAITKKMFTDIETLGLTGDITGNLPAPTIPQVRLNVKIGNLTVIGHSYTAGATQASTGTSDPYQHNIIGKLMGLLGIDDINVNHFGQAASLLTGYANPLNGDNYAGWAGAFQFILPNNNVNINATSDIIVTDPAVSTSGAHVIVHGCNDMVQAGLANVNLTNTTSAWKNALRGVLSRMRSGFVASSTANGSSITWDSTINFVGTWSDKNTVSGNPSNTGPAYKATNTNTDYVEITLPTNFTGGTVAVNMIGQGSGVGTLGSSMTSGQTTLPVVSLAAADSFPPTGRFVVNIAAEGANTREEVLVTAGNDTTTFTVTRGVNGTSASAHGSGAFITTANDTALVTWSTNGSNATITGTSNLGGQGIAGSPVCITKRFVCTGADAGKTIRATVSGIVTNDTGTTANFDSWQIESQSPPPIVITNIQYFMLALSNIGSYTGSATATSSMNSATASVVAEFDGFVQIADIYTSWFNKGGSIGQSMNNTDVTTTGITWTCNSTTYTPVIGLMMSFGGAGERCIITSATNVSPGVWTLSLLRAQGGTAEVTHSNGDNLCPADWQHTDDLHLNARGAAVAAEAIYDAYAAMPTPSTFQIAEAAGNWSQTSQSFVMGIIDQNWFPPPFTGFQSVAIAQNRETAFPVYIPKYSILTGMGVSVISGASVTVRFGIYMPDSTHSRPGQLVQDFGTFTITGSAPYVAQATGIYQVLRPGWYWMGAVQQATAVTLHCCAAGGILTPVLSRSTQFATSLVPFIAGYYQDGVSGALGTPWTTYNEAGPATAANAPISIWYQVRAIQAA